MSQLMILPAKDGSKTRLLRVPDDYEAHEAFRNVTGVIAKVESDDPDYDWDDIAEILEADGYEVLDFIPGPSLG